MQGRKVLDVYFKNTDKVFRVCSTAICTNKRNAIGRINLANLQK